MRSSQIIIFVTSLVVRSKYAFLCVLFVVSLSLFSMIHNSRHRWIINRRTVVLTALIVLLATLYVVSQRVPDSPSPSSSPFSAQESGRNQRDAPDSRSSNDLRSPNEQLLPSRHSPPSPRASLDTRDVIATFDYSELCEPSERLKDACIISAPESSLSRRSTDANECLLTLWRSAESSGCSNGIDTAVFPLITKKKSCIIISAPESSLSRGSTDANRCLLTLWRSAESSGCSNGIDTAVVPPHHNNSDSGGKKDHAASAAPPLFVPPKILCPCVRKSIVSVHAVSILANLYSIANSGGYFALDELIAVTQTLPAADNSSRAILTATWRMDDSRPFYLIDASSSEFIFLTCRKGEATCRKGEANVFNGVASTLKRLLSRLILKLPLNLSTNSDVISRSNDPQHESAMQSDARRQAPNNEVHPSRRPWSCSALRTHRFNTHHEKSGQQSPPPPVFYSFDRYAMVSGNAIEHIADGVGQYVTQGFHAKRVPWLLPCSDDWGYDGAASGDKRSPWLWTQFFVELNDALQFPFYPVDFHKHFDVDSPQFSPLVFGTVHFAAPSIGYSSLCYKSVFQSFVWPHAVRLATKHEWDAVSESRFQNELLHMSATLPHLSSASPHRPASAASLLASISSSPTAPQLSWKTNHRVAIMKVLPTRRSTFSTTTNTSSVSTAAFSSPGRGFTHSDHFDRALLERGILSMSPTLALFERMWHVNNAELIVTTWGSTLTVLINLLFERHQRGDDNVTVQADQSHAKRAASGTASAASDDDEISHAVPTRPLRILILVHPEYSLETTLIFRKAYRYLRNPRRLPKSFSSPLLSKVVWHRM
ncbi:membrane-associated protein, putative, partial [Bodo saltans]